MGRPDGRPDAPTTGRPIGPIRRSRARAGRILGAGDGPREVIGLVAATIAFIAIATTFAFQTPPFLAPDETAHLGYAHEIAGGDLPEIDREPNVPAMATQWQAERASGADDRYRAVWVANHPPLHYIATAPLIWLSDATDRPDGGLMFLRLANVAFAAAGIVFTYLFAVEVTAGARRVALAAAGLTAFLPQAHGLFSAALNDGLAFAAGGALLWTAARCLRRGGSTGDLAMLGVAAAAAWGARTATMLLAVAVVGFVAAARLFDRGTERERIRSVAVSVGLGLGPAVVVFGWFYARMLIVYGDIGGSEFLLDRFQRTSRGGVLDVVTWGHLWVDLYHKLLSPSPTFTVKAPPGSNPVGIAAAVGFVVALVIGRTGDWTGSKVRWLVSRGVVLLGVVSVAVIVATVVQHVSGGGNAYARYLFPVLPVLATYAAIGFDRLVPRVLPAAVLGALMVWAWRNVPTQVDPQSIRRPRDDGRAMPEALTMIPSSPWLRDFVLAAAIAGSAIVAIVVVVGLFGVRPGLIRRRLAERVGIEQAKPTRLEPHWETHRASPPLP